MWLVTGATGHIGNVLVRKLLERGENVRALILPGESRESISGLKVEAFEGDVLNLDSVFESMRGIKGIFHLAGVISIMPGPNPFVRKVNVEGTKNILRAMQKAASEIIPAAVADDPMARKIYESYAGFQKSVLKRGLLMPGAVWRMRQLG